MFSIEKDSSVAWLVCFGAFLTLAGTIGIDSSFGVVLGTIITELNCSTTKASWIQSTHSSAMFLFAFVSSSFLQKCGMRIIIMIGGIVCCISYIICAFYKNYVLLILLYGLAGGAGSGMLYTTGNIACFQYFELYEAMASGLAMSGTGFGIVVVSLSCSSIVINYGYGGYFIAISIISSLSFLFALFVFPLRDDDQNISEEETKGLASIKEKSSLSRTHRLSERETKSLAPIQEKSSLTRTHFISEGETKSIAFIHERSSLTRTHSFRSSGRLRMQSITENKCEQESNTLKDRAKKLMELLSDKRLLSYCFVHVLFELAYYVPMDFLPEMMQYDGISQEKANSIVSIIGFFILIGKWTTALILQYSDANPIIFSSISMILLGICSVLYPFCTNYEYYVIVTAFYGFVLASIDMLIPFIILSFFGSEKLNDAFGIVMLTKAFIPIWGPPIAGALYDLTGTYDLSFYVAGCFQLFGGIINILVFILHLQRIQKDSNEENE